MLNQQKALSGAYDSGKIDTVFVIFTSFLNAQHIGSFGSTESRQTFIQQIRKLMTSIVVGGNDANKRCFRQIIGDNDVSELPIDEVPLFFLATVSGNFWIFEYLPEDTDFQRKIDESSIFGLVARSRYSFEGF
jgi:hypothetical protein